MKPQQDTAYLIHSRPYRDTSLIADLFTAHHGRVSVVCKGARRGKSPKSLLLQPFRSLTTSWSGRSELQTLVSVEQHESAMGESGWHNLAGNELVCGLYINELLWALLHKNDPHPHLFERYRETLNSLRSDKSIESVLRTFELTLLDEIGYGLNFHEDEEAEAISPDQTYGYEISRGFYASESGFGGDFLVRMQGGLPSNREDMKQAKILTRTSIEQLMNGRPIRSRELMRNRHQNLKPERTD